MIQKKGARDSLIVRAKENLKLSYSGSLQLNTEVHLIISF